MSKKTLYVLIYLLFIFSAAGGYCQEPKNLTQESRNNESLIAPELKHIIYKSKMEDEKIGLIESITENDVLINLGRNLNVTLGMEFKVFRKEKRIELIEESESILIGEQYIATLKVIKIDENKAKCKIIDFEPTDYIMVTDKVVSVPGTGYEQIIKQRKIDKKAKTAFIQAKKAGRTSKESAIELFNKLVTEFPQSTYTQVAQEELERYKRIADNSDYKFERIHNPVPEKGSASSISKDIAVDSNNNIWLLDTKKIQLQKFNMLGELLITLERKNKYDREIMRTPANLAIDQDDNIYVLDIGLKKVSKFDKDGNFVNDYGPRDSQRPLIKPVDIGVNSTGDVFILDAGSSQVLAFNKDNKFWASFGYFDISLTKTPDLIAIDVDEDDNIYVLDRGTKYLHIFESDLRIKGKMLIQKISKPIDMAVAFHKAYFLDTELCSAIEYDLALEKITNNFGLKGSGQGKFSDPSGIDIDNEANIYIADGANLSFQKFGPEANFIYKFGNTLITKVGSFAVNNANNLYVLDAKNGEYQELNKYGKGLMQISLKSEFKNPNEIVMDFEGNIYILDSKAFKIHKFSQNGESLLTFGSKNMFKSPIDICVDKESNIYVLDDKEYTVKKFDANGNHLQSFGEKLIKKRKQIKGQFKKPSKIAINSTGTVFVLDTKLKEVFKFDSQKGELISTFKNNGKEFSRPVDIAVDGLGFIYIADSKDSNIYKLQDNGTFVATVINTDLKQRQIKPIASISVDGIGNVYALDRATNQIFEFRQ